MALPTERPSAAARPGTPRTLLASVLAWWILACGAAPDSDTSSLSGERRSVASESETRRTGPELELRGEPGLEGLARSLGADPRIWSGLPAIDDSVLSRDTVTVWFVRDLASLAPVGLDRWEPWVAGVADPARKRIGLRVDGAGRNPAALRTVYRHEAAHVALHAATGGRAPRWLHEGYAQLATGTWSWSEAWRLQFALLRGGHSSLAGIDRAFSREGDPDVAYMLSYTAVATLLDRGGERGLEAWFAELRAGSDAETALRRVYGLTITEFEERWRHRVLDRYGWLYLLSRTAFLWLGVTLLVVFVGVSRVRNDRKRLAEMRERERRESELAAFLRSIFRN